MRPGGPIVADTSPAIQATAQREGYSLVVDQTGLTLSGAPAFLSVQDSLDITADIIKTLNATAPSGAAAAPAAPATDPKSKK